MKKIREKKILETLLEIKKGNFDNIDYNVEMNLSNLILDEVLGENVDLAIKNKPQILGSLKNVNLKIFDSKKNEIENLKANIKRLILKDGIKPSEMLIIGDDRYRKNLEFINYSFPIFETKTYDFFKFVNYDIETKKISELINLLSVIEDDKIKEVLHIDIKALKDDLILTGDKNIFSYFKTKEEQSFLYLYSFFRILDEDVDNVFLNIFSFLKSLRLDINTLDRLSKKIIVGDYKAKNGIDFIQYDEIDNKILLDKKVVFVLGFNEAFFFKKGYNLKKEDEQKSFKIQEYQFMKKMQLVQNSLIFITAVDEFNYNKKYIKFNFDYNNEIDDFENALIKKDIEELNLIAKNNTVLYERLNLIKKVINKDFSDFDFDKDKFQNNGSSLSVTKLESFNRCPLNSFLTYELDLKEKETLTIESRVIGNFMHKVLEIIFNPLNEKILRDCSSEDFNFLVDDTFNKLSVQIPINNEKERSFLHEFLLKFKKELNILRKQYLISNFKIKDVEKNISINIGANRISGKIDRVDFLNNNILLIDYKSSNKDLTEKTISEGTALQLPLYAKYYKENGYNISGMFYKEIKGIKSKDNNHFFTGLTKTEDLNDIDKNLDEPSFINVKFNKDGNISKSSKVYNDLDKFISLAEDIALETIDKIKNNEIKAKPIEDRICDYCNFKSICNKWC